MRWLFESRNLIGQVEVGLEVQPQNVSPTQTELLPGAAAPAPPPRPISRQARRRSWIEPRVRFWWLVGAFSLAVSLWFCGHGIYTCLHENWLLSNGSAVSATVEEVGSGGNETGGIKGKAQPPDGRVVAHYEVAGQTHQLVGWLKGRTEWIIIGGEIPIHIDPANPDDWTGITSPISPIGEDEVKHGLGMLPIAVVVGGIAVWLRRRMLRLWTDGQAVDATVIESRTSAMAPRLRELRCAPVLEGQHRVQRVFAPLGLGKIGPGDHVWLLCEPGEKWAVTTAWFD